MSMDIMVILLMAVGVVVFVGEPLVRRARQPGYVPSGDHELEQLGLQKETLYTAIRDLDFDFQTGKVDQKDYTELRQQLEGEAVHILRRIDAADPLAGLDQDLERQIIALRRHQVALPPVLPQSHCPGCGVRLQGDENFCPTCGRPLLSA
jgi:hypothetical protein